MRLSFYLGSFLPLFLLSTLLAAAQPIKPPSLSFMDGDKQVSLDLAKVQVNTIIKGYVAETTETLTFHNPTNRILQGDLDFPLPDGATISGFGLDIDGVMVDGVPVPKDEARVTFEKEVRKGVDPGLAEQTAGNGFRTRVYPIRANSDRTVKVQYVADLTDVVVGDGAVSYRLPLRWGKAIGDVSIHIEVMDSPAAPEIRGAAMIAVEKQGEKYVGDFSAKAVDFASDLVVALPQPPAQSLVVEKRTSCVPTEEDLSGAMEKPEFYFAIHDLSPDAPKVKRSQMPARIDHLGICWDASLNRAESDKSREIDLLGKILKQVNPGQVDLIVFSNTTEPAKAFAIKDGSFSAVIDAINGVTYDGGLNLSNLKLSKSADQEYLLFSSGLVNIGDAMPGLMEVPVYPITNEPRADYGLLRRIAAESGGTFFNLLRASDEQVIKTFDGNEPYSLISIEVKDGDAKDIYPKGRQVVAGRLVIAGRLISSEATVVLNYGIGTTVVNSVTYKLKQSNTTETGIVPRLWAQMKLADLATDPQKNASEISSLGHDFNLVTSNTSLLVLETLQQYLTYRIVPPKTRPDIYKQFVEQIEQQVKSVQKTKEERIAQTVGLWDERVKWWEAEYKYKKGFKYRDPTGGTGNDGIVGGGSFTNGTSSSAGYGVANAGQGDTHAPPAPPAAIPGAQDEHDQYVVLAHRENAALDVDRVQLNMFAGVAVSKPIGELSNGPSITIKPWDPNTPYLAAMKSAGANESYNTYLKQRKDFATAPAFYLDCADYLLKTNHRDQAVRVLTDIPALKLESPELLRIAAARFRQIGEFDLAVDLYEKTMKMRPEEPQCYRDLALALADRARSAKPSTDAARMLANSDFTRALDLLNQVVVHQPDGRFPGIEIIAMEEANRILAQAQAMDKNFAGNGIDSRLTKMMDLDLRVVMQWDTPDTDIDLWVTEPSGEKCFYGHNRTVIGGMLSNDITQGYGPEEYNLRKAMPGKYKIQANFYGSHSQAVTGPTTIHATVFTHWGRPDEKKQSLTVRLTENKEVVDIGEVTIEP